MTTYDLTSTTPSKLSKGDILNCPYSGAVKSITLPQGTYKLEVWGAQGGTGNPSANIGGNGGYSTGILTLGGDTTIYCVAGQVGYSKVESTVFNGGGMAEASSSYNSGSGGGASDIRIGTNSLYARVIVAGGGGGGAGANETTYAGAYGGGISGGTSSANSSGAKDTASGGTQTSGGSSTATYTGLTGGTFGNGGSYAGGGARSGGGGGGGWYGGGAGSYGTAGGGGSGYVYTSSTSSNYPSGCLLNSSYYLTDAQTIAGNSSFTSPTGSSETGHTGNGYCRITVMKLATSFAGYVNIGGSWKEVDTAYANIRGTWKEVEGIHANIGGSWKESG